MEFSNIIPRNSHNLENLFSDSKVDIAVGNINLGRLKTVNNPAFTFNLITNDALNDIKNQRPRIVEEYIRNAAIFKHSKDPNNSKLEIVVNSNAVEQIRKNLAEDRTFTVMHPNGSQITYDVNDISVRAFTTEESTVLEKALTNYFNYMLEKRKSEEAKANGVEVSPISNHPEISSSKLKDTKTVPAFKNTMDPEFPSKAVKAVLAELILISAARSQKREQETIKKEDKIKETDLKRTELREEIKRNDIKAQNEKIDNFQKTEKKHKAQKEHFSKVK